MAVKDVTVEISPNHQAVNLNDNDDRTCVKDVMSVTVSWAMAYPLTWTRFVVKNLIQVKNITMSYQSKDGKKLVPCKHQRLYIVYTNTIDIRCLDNVTTSSVKIEGSLTNLCSVYINGGRNLAYKQKAELTSVYHNFNGDRAVDGNTNSSFNSGTCAHSGVKDDSPKLTLTLYQPAVIYRVLLYNRDILQKRLRSFILGIFNNAGQKIFDYIDSSTEVQAVYEVNVKSSLAETVVVNVNQTSPEKYDHKPILIICELEVYGECPPGKWGLTCTRECPENCGQYCHIDDGSCNVSCIGSSDPPKCATECVNGNWGLNCLQMCSNCFNFSCDRHTGQCNEGCLGYSDPPVCRTSCSKGYYGVNCSKSCPGLCLNQTCDPISGHCNGCLDNFQGELCDIYNSRVEQTEPGFAHGLGIGGALTVVLCVLFIVMYIRQRRQIVLLLSQQRDHIYNKPIAVIKESIMYKDLNHDAELNQGTVGNNDQNEYENSENVYNVVE